MTECQIYAQASLLAFIAMGKQQRPNYRNNKRKHLAVNDPLAHWELTERIVELVRAGKEPCPS